MVMMDVPCKSRIRFSQLVIHLVGGGLNSGIEDDGRSPGHCSSGVVDLLVSSCYAGGL